MHHASPEETRRHLITRVAWMYFIEGLKQEDIAKALGLNRIKINRLLAAARGEGVVSIEIRGVDAFRPDLTRRLRDRFGLQEVHVVPRAANPQAAVPAVGFALGSYLNDRLADGMTVGIAGSHSTNALMEGLRAQSFQSLDVVGLKGCLSNEGKGIPHETVARLAYLLNANAYQLAAPSYARDEQEYRLFMELPMIRSVLERARNADMAILTASRVVEHGGLVGYGFVNPADMAELRRAGAVAAVLGTFVNAAGVAVDHPLNARQIGLTVEELQRIPNVVLTCAGEGKAAALRAALQMRFAKILFTDEETAEDISE